MLGSVSVGLSAAGERKIPGGTGLVIGCGEVTLSLSETAFVKETRYFCESPLSSAD